LYNLQEPAIFRSSYARAQSFTYWLHTPTESEKSVAIEFQECAATFHKLTCVLPNIRYVHVCTPEKLPV